MALHKNLDTADGIHIPYAWTYASSTSREAATGFVASDVGKFARQLDDNSIWMLITTAPTWSEVSASTSPTITHLSLLCRKGSSGTIPKGSPVYLSGWNVGGWVEVEAAKADSDSTMPAVGLTRAALTNTAEGEIVISGVIADVDSSSWSVGNELYVSAATAGQLTTTRPTGAAHLIQKVCKVLRSDATAGQLQVIGAGRTNALPNLTEGKYWLGDSNNQPAEAVPFGAHTQDAASEAESSTSSTSYVQKLRLTTPVVPAGRYRVGWHYEWQCESAANDSLVQVQVDDTTVLMEMVQEPADAGSDQWNNKAGFGYVTLTNASHTIDLDYRAGNALYSCHIRRARLELWRVS